MRFLTEIVISDAILRLAPIPVEDLDGNPNKGEGMTWKKSIVKVLSGLLMLGTLGLL